MKYNQSTNCSISGQLYYVLRHNYEMYVSLYFNKIMFTPIYREKENVRNSHKLLDFQIKIKKKY